MKVCVLSFNPKLIESSVLDNYDLLILPDSLEHVKDLVPHRRVKFVPITSLDHKFEFEMLSEFVEQLRVELDKTLPNNVWPMMARAIYLSAIKSELRFLIHISSTIRYLDVARAESITILYRYCSFDALFSDYTGEIEWVSCNTAPSLGRNSIKKAVQRYVRRGVRIIRKLIRAMRKVIHRGVRIIRKLIRAMRKVIRHGVRIIWKLIFAIRKVLMGVLRVLGMIRS